jgi:hypothetical protein
MRNHTCNTRTRFVSGFTILELIVTLSIFTALTGLLLFNFQTFESRTTLDAVTQEVALAFRQAQVYGVSIHEFQGAQGSVFPPYGVNFDTAFFSGSAPTAFVLYADVLPDENGDQEYSGTLDCESSTECTEKIILRQGYTVQTFCGVISPGASCDALSSLDVIFRRPNPEAIILGKYTSGGSKLFFIEANVVISAPTGETKTVIVRSSGQISVK